MEKSKLSDSFVKVDSDDEFSIVEENNSGNDVGYNSHNAVESVHFHQLPGSTVCVSDDSKTSLGEASAYCMESSVESNEAKNKVSHNESTIVTIRQLREKTEALEEELTVANKTLKSSLCQLASQKKEFDDLKQSLEAELQKVKEEAEQLKEDNMKLFEKIVKYEKSNDKNDLKSLTDAATEMETVECEARNAKAVKDENEKINRSLERLRNDFDANLLLEKHESEIQLLRSENELKQEMINELKSKLEDIQALTEQLAPVLDDVVKEREAKESAMKMVKQLEEEQKQSLEEIGNLQLENRELLDVAESFVELISDVQQSSNDLQKPSNVSSERVEFYLTLINIQASEKYMCLQCWKHFRNIQDAKLHDGNCTSGFDAYF